MNTPVTLLNETPFLAPDPSSPRRRHPAQQPPSLLTTSLENNARNATLGAAGAPPTPLSTSTTLSSPFSARSQSSYAPPTPGGAMSARSPHTSRHTPNFSAQYNPQQWAPMSNASPMSAQQAHHPRTAILAPRPVGPDEPVVSPPPPYSPRREGEAGQSTHAQHNTASPSETTSPETETSRYTTPLTSAHTLSPDFQPSTRQSTSRVQHSSSAAASPNPLSNAAFPPPPSANPSTSRLRSASREQAGRLLSSLTSRNRSNTTSPVNTNDTLQWSTPNPVDHAQHVGLESPLSRAPASKRAASTGDISLESGFDPYTFESLPLDERGLSLPPPPPGPPPNAARTQSLNRPTMGLGLERGPVASFLARRPPGQGTSLGPVPPTPADWRDDGESPVPHPHTPQVWRTPLHIDTGSIVRRHQDEQAWTASATSLSHSRRATSAGGLARTPAVRNRSSMGLRERRSESKHRGDGVHDASTESESTPSPSEGATVRPSNLDLVSTTRPQLQRHNTVKRSPGAGTIVAVADGAVSSNRPAWADQRPPRNSSPLEDLPQGSSPTPPASAKEHGIDSNSKDRPARSSLRFSQKLSLAMGFKSDERPISHIFHTPNPDDTLQVPLTPASQARLRPNSDLIGPESPRAFAERAVERHRRFADREAAAATDSERLELFIGFMIAESKIRREQYNEAFAAEDLDMNEIAKELFQPIPVKDNPATSGTEEPQMDSSRPASTNSSIPADHSSQDAMSNASRNQDSPSSATSASSAQPPLTGGLKDFIPCLSPIASMSAVTGQEDEMNSRGRPPSRWWDTASKSGSAAGDGFSVLGRTKRESKYMGVPKEARDSAAVFQLSQAATGQSPRWQGQSSDPGASNASGDYPPEKVGWHEETAAPMIPPPPLHPPSPPAVPLFPANPTGLDISRLITLPPPYPRHHPAVNNAHPDLAAVRNVVRSLHETAEPDMIRDDYTSKLDAKRKRAESWCEHQRSLHVQDVQYRMENEQLTQEQFDGLESELEEKIQQSDKNLVQADFDLYQDLVVQPLHALFSRRITLATATIESLSNALFTAVQSHSPNLPQEEGDEQPELLEKLTQLKWLFEARETLHRRTYDLLSERNGRYKAIVILPYKQSQNNTKISEAEHFFSQDSQDRLRAFDKAIQERAEAFLSVVEQNVGRGVEMLLDAFWQIAPGIKEVVQKVPSDLQQFEVQIPADEYDENPSYQRYPLQYLSSLLSHAEKATYQFIESQVNLLCLLHEIRSCALSARCSVEGHGGQGREQDARRSQEERQLTADLKERVSDVEGQWADALGEELRCARERVRERLLEDGGWDDEVDEL